MKNYIFFIFILLTQLLKSQVLPDTIVLVNGYETRAKNNLLLIERNIRVIDSLIEILPPHMVRKLISQNDTAQTIKSREIVTKYARVESLEKQIALSKDKKEELNKLRDNTLDQVLADIATYDSLRAEITLLLDRVSQINTIVKSLRQENYTILTGDTLPPKRGQKVLAGDRLYVFE